jgi:hypothetical protein
MKFHARLAAYIIIRQLAYLIIFSVHTHSKRSIQMGDVMLHQTHTPSLPPNWLSCLLYNKRKKERKKERIK